MRGRLFCAAVVLALLAGLIGVPGASAEVEHPRQAWLRAATAGLFLHWGMFTAPRHLDCAQWEHDVTAGGWSADYWVDEARKLGASYIVLATFHSRLGYARPWPSRIPGSCATQRDLLGELVDAGKAKDVKIILYMTDDPQWHSEQGIQTLNSAAYSAHKGQQVDLTTRRGFGMYSYDLFFEVMDNYPDLAGFWIDNDNEFWEENHLYEQIRQRRPSWLLSNNNEDTPIMDAVSNEQKTGMTPSYDYPQAAFTPMPRLVEADYKLPTTGDWWFDGGSHEVDFRLSTGRYITNAGSSMKSLMAETPMVNGKFPPQQEAFNNFMAGWVPPIRSSLFGTEGGGYMHGGMQPGFWNDGAHGVITVEPGARTQYVHVVTRPRTNLVRLRDNGYKVVRVTDLRTGERMRFNQSGGHLSILDIKNWDTYDTVFKVDTVGQLYFHDQATIKATASSTRDGFPASNLVDGSYTDYWDSGARVPVSVTLDLGKRRPATSLAVNQREWSPTYARSTFGRPEDSARIKDYRVWVSDDGNRWQQARAGAMRSARGVQYIDIGEQVTRYVKLEILNLWGGPQAPRFFNELQIDEIRVAYSNPTSFGTSAPLEAESPHNTRAGNARLDLCLACSGAFQIVGLGGGEANSVTYRDVRVAENGDYRLQLDTTAGHATSVSLRVNGAAAIDVPVAADRPDVPAGTAIVVPLRAGNNTVAVFSNAAEGPGLDRLAVAPLPPSSYLPKTTLTVEPHGVQWVGPGQQSIRVTATLRLDADDAIDGVRLAPTAPAGWSIEGAAVTAPSMRLGQTISGSWVLTSPPGQDVTAVTAPVTASFQVLGRAKQVTSNVAVRPRPADRVFMREAEDSANKLGSTGLTGCGPCSGGEKVRNIGGSPDAFVQFDNVTVDTAGRYTLYIDFTVNGPRSFFVTVNGGAPVEVPVDGVGNNTPDTTTVPVTLNAGANTIKIHNDTLSAPDLDRLSLGS
ncbi:MAG TPA: CBM35 domain-containing protein [Actinophytocola sp.]|nr:CBM35 domain-containing protein [Actinophytocola sp.]HEV2778787.1 CBM35 domain-containing protein [Actinophytocola sp.]